MAWIRVETDGVFLEGKKPPQSAHLHVCTFSCNIQYTLLCRFPGLEICEYLPETIAIDSRVALHPKYSVIALSFHFSSPPMEIMPIVSSSAGSNAFQRHEKQRKSVVVLPSTWYGDMSIKTWIIPFYRLHLPYRASANHGPVLAGGEPVRTSKLAPICPPLHSSRKSASQSILWTDLTSQT
jgi:hypothetical protein